MRSHPGADGSRTTHRELARKSAGLEQEIERRKIVEGKLRESEDALPGDLYLREHGHGHADCREDATICLVNAEYEKMFGLPPQGGWKGKTRWTSFCPMGTSAG